MLCTIVVLHFIFYQPTLHQSRCRTGTRLVKLSIYVPLSEELQLMTAHRRSCTNTWGCDAPDSGQVEVRLIVDCHTDPGA